MSSTEGPKEKLTDAQIATILPDDPSTPEVVNGFETSTI